MSSGTVRVAVGTLTDSGFVFKTGVISRFGVAGVNRRRAGVRRMDLLLADS
jgi:hypothetical protein